MRVRDVKVTVLTATTYANRQHSPHATVQVSTDDGLTGISRCFPAHARVIDEQLAPVLRGQDPLNTERLWRAMYDVVRQNSRLHHTMVTAVGALDIALWDLKGKALNTPVHRLLGGFRDQIPKYADERMLDLSPAQHAGWCAKYVARGYRAVKYHMMGEAPDVVVETTRCIRDAVGPGVKIMIDVHKMWDPWMAVETARRLESYDVFWLEEPISWDDQVGGMAFLAANTRISVAAGESESNLYACRDLVQRGGVKVLQTDVIGGGGYTPWLKLAAVAGAFHAQAAPHGASFPELLAPLIAALPNGLIVSGAPAGEPSEIWSKLYREPLEVRDGVCHLRDRPGLGLEFEEAYIKAHQA